MSWVFGFPAEASAVPWRSLRALFTAGIILWIWIPTRKVRRQRQLKSLTPLLLGGHAPEVGELLARMPILWEALPPPFLLSNPVVQLLIFTVQQCLQERAAPKRYAFEDESLEVDLPDLDALEASPSDATASPDALSGSRSPGSRDTVVLSWLKTSVSLPDDAPVVLIAPGLNCTKESLPGTSVYDALLSRPCRVATYHKRAIGGLLAAPIFHLFGHPSDFQAAIEHIAGSWPRAPIHIVGYSSGNGLTGSHAAIYGSKPHPNIRSYLLLVGGANYNVAFAPERPNVWSSLLLDYGLLYFTKQRVLLRNREVLSAADPDGFEKAVGSRTMQGLYDLCMRHFCGFPRDRAGEAEAKLNPFSGGVGVLKPCRVPLLWVLTEDDPVMPGGPPASWMETLGGLDFAALAMFKHGSHCACYTSWRLERWVDRLLLEWLDAHSGSPQSPAACQ
mmetsp:Transcript_11905/g.38270  ORF Transcript_11905/g.38270 Transcript_11905/m.38270 type:complete len:447 (-) Transcript_11905:112-1452(-)